MKATRVSADQELTNVTETSSFAYDGGRIVFCSIVHGKERKSELRLAAGIQFQRIGLNSVSVRSYLAHVGNKSINNDGTIQIYKPAH